MFSGTISTRNCNGPSLAVLGFFAFSINANAACGKLVIAEQNWASAELMANVDKIILEKGYGVKLN